MAESGISHKKRKRAETESVDRLSSLPDSLILHILSFLPTKEAVATSFLSKRSKPLWRSLHTLDFQDRSYNLGDSRFVRFVNAVLTLRGFEPIKRFRLRTLSFVPRSNLKAWLNVAINRHVEELEFSFGVATLLLPSIFVSSTIRVLKLKRVSIAKLPSVHLPSLKVLHLESAVFINKESAVKLLSGCKLLEELVMVDSCGIYSIEYVKGLPQLVKAQVDGYMILLPWKALRRVQFLSVDSVTTVRFKYWCPIWKNLGFPNLTHLEFIYFNHCRSFLMGWLHKCPKLQTLVIREFGPTFTEPSHGGMERRLMEPKFVPQCLSGRLEKFYLGECQGLDNELQLARAIMENARALKTVTICSISSSSENEKLQMIKRLASYPRASETCRLLFS